jgi:hydrogenase maturation protein HypF
VRGVVQGVGFRPFVYRLAVRHRLQGWVRNESGAVRIVVEGGDADLERFLRGLRDEAPPLARVERIEHEPCEPNGLSGFAISDSEDRAGAVDAVPPDSAICPACEAELFDPASRRYRYPFITCTECGPRFTLIERLPYDRARTSMRAFAQCAQCLAEYADADDRRYHSETNSCPCCGPRLWYEAPGAGPGPVEGDRALAAAAAVVCSGGVLALRGLGGFHLAVVATDAEAVRRLRTRKRRERKPLAVMVRTLEEATALGCIDPEEAALLTSAARPIVLLRRRPASALAPAVTPGLDTIGVMLAYTPLHHLLLAAVRRPLVMTSGNRSEEPIAIGNEEACRRLAGIADGFLLHDREIVARYDDSVVRRAGTATILLRRARGLAPLPIPLAVPSPVPLLAVGPHLKNTFTLASGDRAWVSQHIGDLEGLETRAHFIAALDRLRRLSRIEASVAVRDLHPGYHSTALAEGLGLDRVLAVQHHHAHVAAVLSEHGHTGAALGLAYDGTGYGDDGRIWGAELLLADLRGYRRLAHLRYAPMPGGDLAARTPWRCAAGFLALEPAAAPAFRLAFEDVPPHAYAVVAQQAVAGLNAPLTSSMGRLFDAAAAVLGVRRVADYEGQAPMELEALAGRRPGREHRSGLLSEVDGGWVLDPVPLLVALGERRQSGEDAAALAADLHDSVAWASAELVRRARDAGLPDLVALCGGVFQNARLLGSVRERVERLGMRVLVPVRLGPNDGAVSYGQAAVAAAQLASH